MQDAVPLSGIKNGFLLGETPDETGFSSSFTSPKTHHVTSLFHQEEALARAGEAHGIDVSFASPEFLAKASKLAWVQIMSAGVDRYITIDRASP